LPKINPFFILIIGAIAIAFSPIFVRFSDVDPIMTAFYRIFISLPFFLFLTIGAFPFVFSPILVDFPNADPLMPLFIIIFIS